MGPDPSLCIFSHSARFPVQSKVEDRATPAIQRPILLKYVREVHLTHELRAENHLNLQLFSLVSFFATKKLNFKHKEHPTPEILPMLSASYDNEFTPSKGLWIANYLYINT